MQPGRSEKAMEEFNIITAREKERYQKLNGRLEPLKLPEFLNFDDVLVRYWSALEEQFPDYQYLLVSSSTGEPVARGRCIPLRFDEDWPALPEGGLDWALEKGFCDQQTGREPNMLSALFIVISKHHLGSGLSYHMLAAMREIGRQHGYAHLIAPVRPSMKSRYPLIPMAEYSRWKRADNSPLDPWIRVHVKSGGEILHPCSEAMAVEAKVARWTEWTGMEFPGDGSYIVPGGLVPLSVSHGNDRGSYVEPGVWVLHKTGPQLSEE